MLSAVDEQLGREDGTTATDARFVEIYRRVSFGGSVTFSEERIRANEFPIWEGDGEKWEVFRERGDLERWDELHELPDWFEELIEADHFEDMEGAQELDEWVKQ